MTPWDVLAVALMAVLAGLLARHCAGQARQRRHYSVSPRLRFQRPQASTDERNRT